MNSCQSRRHFSPSSDGRSSHQVRPKVPMSKFDPFMISDIPRKCPSIDNLLIESNHYSRQQRGDSLPSNQDFLQLIERTSETDIKYSNSSYLVDPTSVQLLGTKKNSLGTTKISNNRKNIGQIAVLYPDSHLPIYDFHLFKRDSFSDMGEYTRNTRSRSSSPHRCLKYKTRFMMDTHTKYFDHSAFNFPRNHIRTHIPENGSADSAIDLACYSSGQLASTSQSHPSYQLLQDWNDVSIKTDFNAADSAKENVNYHTILRDTSLSVKRRPSELTLNRSNASSSSSNNEVNSPLVGKPVFRDSIIDPSSSLSPSSRLSSPYQSFSTPCTPEKEPLKTNTPASLHSINKVPLKLSNNNIRVTGNNIQKALSKTNSTSFTLNRHLQQASPMSINLLRLGPRLLWCELPQVRELGLLRKLTPGQRQLQEAMFEVITSEASYFASLDILVNHFMENIVYSDSLLIDPRRKADLFSNISIIRELSKNLMNIFEHRWKQNIVLTDICDILADYALMHFGPYINYCRYKKRQEETLRDLQMSSNFSCLLKQLEADPLCQGLTFHSYLLLPLQRVTRYPLLIEAILRRVLPDSVQYSLCKKALFVTGKLVKECNTAANQYDNYMDMVSKMNFSNIRGFSLNEPRWIIMNVEVTRIKSETQSSILIGTFRAPHWSNSPNILSIMSDLIVLSKKKGDDLIVYDYCSRDLVQVRRIDCDTNERIFNFKPSENLKNFVKMIFLHNYRGKRVEYCFSFLTIQEKEDCVNLLDPKNNFIRNDYDIELLRCPRNNARKEGISTLQSKRKEMVPLKARNPRPIVGCSHEIFI